MTIKAEVTPEGRRKLITIRQIPSASGRILARWGAQTVKTIILYADHVFSKKPRARSAQLRRNVGLEVRSFVGSTRVTVGTGVGAAKNVAYAQIQDKGGMTHPTVTLKMRRWAWAMHRQEFGREVRGLGLKGAERKGAAATWQNMSIYRAIALTKKSKLNILVPPTGWFSTPIKERTDVLHEYLRPASILTEAEKGVE